MSCERNKNYEELYIQKCEEFDIIELEYNEFKGIQLIINIF